MLVITGNTLRQQLTNTEGKDGDLFILVIPMINKCSILKLILQPCALCFNMPIVKQFFSCLF